VRPRGPGNEDGSDTSTSFPGPFLKMRRREKALGTGWSSMYSDWSMTSTLLCNLGLIYTHFGIN
jgi:hypothetical protein